MYFRISHYNTAIFSTIINNRTERVGHYVNSSSHLAMKDVTNYIDYHIYLVQMKLQIMNK